MDRQFGELHTFAIPFKQDALALIWPQCLANKSLKAHFEARSSLAYFSIRRANIAFVAEYVLYAMPGEEAYGKNDIVFACEGFLPLVLDPQLVLEPESWRLFNELKVQIYIQRLDQSGPQEADSRVLPNLFVENLSSYSGLEVPAESEIEFDKLATQTKQELIGAQANLDYLRSNHPYNRFAIWALKFLKRCASRVDEEQEEFERSSIPAEGELESASTSSFKPNNHQRNKRPRTQAADDSLNHPTTSTVELDIHPNSSNDQVDINVDQNAEEDYPLQQDGDLGSKGRYNPYRLGRGKGPTSLPRRRWTKEEYDLLLEEVRLHSNKYDCMAQIIKRHGKNGELSETFKDQNNVSLKDKARNLTMEWQRHGYPEDKPWLKEAFARFSVKQTTKPYNEPSNLMATMTNASMHGVNQSTPVNEVEEELETQTPRFTESCHEQDGDTRRTKKSRRHDPRSRETSGGQGSTHHHHSGDIGVMLPVIEGFESTILFEEDGQEVTHYSHPPSRRVGGDDHDRSGSGSGIDGHDPEHPQSFVRPPSLHPHSPSTSTSLPSSTPQSILINPTPSGLVPSDDLPTFDPSNVAPHSPLLVDPNLLNLG